MKAAMTLVAAMLAPVGAFAAVYEYSFQAVFVQDYYVDLDSGDRYFPDPSERPDSSPAAPGMLSGYFRFEHDDPSDDLIEGPRLFQFGGNVLPQGEDYFYAYDETTGNISVSFSNEYNDVDAHFIDLLGGGGTLEFWLAYAGENIEDEDWLDEHFEIDYHALFEVLSWERQQPTSPVPVPHALPLLAGGVGTFSLLGWLRHRGANRRA